LEVEFLGYVEDRREIAKKGIRQFLEKRQFWGEENRQKNRLKKKSVV